MASENIIVIMIAYHSVHDSVLERISIPHVESRNRKKLEFKLTIDWEIDRPEISDPESGDMYEKYSIFNSLEVS